MNAELINVLEKIIEKKIDKTKIPTVGVGTIEADGNVFIDANVPPYPIKAFHIPDSLKDRKVPIELEIESGTAKCTVEDKEGTVDLAGCTLTGTLTIKTSLQEGDMIYFMNQVGGNEFVVVGRSSNGDLTRS